MTISSTQIANILQGQVGMFSAAAQYAQAVSAQYGFQPSTASPVQDPRDSDALQGGMLASGGLRAPGFMAGVGGMAAMFNAAPRQLDPFTMTAHAATRGYQAAGASGAIGAGAAVGGAYLALGSVFKWGVDQAVFGAQQQAMLNHQIGGMAPKLNSSQVGQMSSMVSQAARSGMGSVNEITSLMQQGGADGTINMQSLQQFQQSFTKLIGNVRSVATALNSSLTEAQQAMQQVRQLGVGGSDAAGFLGAMKGIGQVSGLGPQQMMGLAQQGANLGQLTGINRQSSAMGQMVQGGVLGMVGRHNLIDNVDVGAGGRYQGAAFRFLGSRYGRTPLAAMMGRDGEFDEEAGARIAAGQVSRKEMQEMARQNLSGKGRHDMFRARRQELMGSFVSQFGGQAIQSPMDEMLKGVGNPETMRARLTGLTRQDQAGMRTLDRAMGGLRSKLAQEGKAAFDRGAGKMGLGDAIGQNIEQILAPYRMKLERFGADLSQSAQEVLEGLTKQFVSAPPTSADPSTYARYFRAHLMGGGNPISQSIQRGMAAGGGGVNYAAGSPTGSMLPSGLQIARHGQNVGLGELPMYGMAPMGHNPYMGAAALGSIPWSGGRNAMGAIGDGIGKFGKGMMAASAAEGSGFMGMGGIGIGAGTGRAAGLAARVGGGVLSGLGRLTGALAVPMVAHDLITNELPQIQRNLGYRPITQGSMMGDGASAMQFASQTGLLSSPLERHKVGGWVGGMSYEQMQKQGLVGVGGMQGAGYQDFANQTHRDDFNQLMRGTGAALAGFAKFGEAGGIAATRATGRTRDPRAQAASMANQLGITHEQASRHMLAIRAQNLHGKWSGKDPADFRKEWLARQRNAYDVKVKRQQEQGMLGTPAERRRRRNINNAQAAMIAGADPRNAALLGGATLDQQLEETGLAPQDPKYKAFLIQKFGVLSAGRPGLGLQGGDMTAAADLVAAGRVKPPSGDSRWSDPRDQFHASNWSKEADSVNSRLMGERASARQGMWSASTIGGFNMADADAYAQDYSEGMEKTDTNQNGEIDDHRVTSAEAFMRKLLDDPRATHVGLSKAAAQMSRGNTGAEQRGSLFVGEAGRLKRDIKHGKSATQIISRLMGTKFDAADKMQAHFKAASRDPNMHMSPDIEAKLLRETRKLYKLGAGDKPINSEEAEAFTAEMYAAGRAYAGGDKDAFKGIAPRIATMLSQAPPTGGRPGDFSKQMTEVMVGMKQFKEALNAISELSIVKFALKLAAH